MQVPEKITGFFKSVRDKKAFRVCTNKYALVTIAALVILMIDPNGILTLWGNRREIARQRAAIEKYHRDIADIESRIESLSTNKDSIEAFAREEYFYHLDNEDVFIVE